MTEAPDARWYFRLNGLDRGPVPWETLEGLARGGELLPVDLVRRSDSRTWQPASQARLQQVEPARARRTIQSAVAYRATVAERIADNLLKDSASHVPAIAYRRAGSIAPACVTPIIPEQPGGTALLALALAFFGIFQLALPLGMFAIYLGGRSAKRLRRTPGAAIYVAASACLVGLVDVGVSLWVLAGKAIAMTW